MVRTVRRKRAIIVLAVCVLVGIGVVAFWPGEKEPEYKGKKLSEWLWIAANLSMADREVINASQTLEGITVKRGPGFEAACAVRAIGTNALPYLVRWTRDQPKWRQPVAKIYQIMPSFLHNRTMAELAYGRDESSAAVIGFQIMGPDEVLALPELIGLLESSRADDATKMHVMWCLAAMKSRAQPALDVLKKVASETGYPYRFVEARATMESIQAGSTDFLKTNASQGLHL